MGSGPGRSPLVWIRWAPCAEGAPQARHTTCPGSLSPASGSPPPPHQGRRLPMAAEPTDLSHHSCTAARLGTQQGVWATPTSLCSQSSTRSFLAWTSHLWHLKVGHHLPPARTCMQPGPQSLSLLTLPFHRAPGPPVTEAGVVLHRYDAQSWTVSC